MEIQDQIRTIISRRRDRLPAIEEKLRVLAGIRESISRMEAVRDQMIGPDGAVIEGGRFSPMLKKNPDMAWGLQALDSSAVREAADKAAEALEAYRTRCMRQTVSISVVGKARCGKSQLLKAVSGLSDQVIPAFDSTDCTGAPSVICNVPGSRVQARLSFKTGPEMVRAARTYLERMIPDPSARPMLYRMEDIRTLDLRAVEEGIPEGSEEGVLMEYLEKMVLHYEEWAGYAGGADMVLDDEKEIITFVAQNNGISLEDERKGRGKREEYYRYLAVNTCEITCSFPQEGIGSISLIDTVGLGDHTDGILDSMLETVRDRSDAVVFVHMPHDGTAGGLPEDIVGIYKSIKEKCGDRALDQWLFYFINNVEKPTAKYGVNTEFCEGACRRIANSKWLGAHNAKIVNVTDTKAVQNEFLLPLLSELLKNLDSIDETFRRPAAEAMKVLYGEYSGLCTRAQKVLCSDIRGNASLAPLIHRLTDQGMTGLRTVLFQAARSWREKRDQPCIAMDDSCRDIFLRMRQTGIADAYLPTQQEILDELNTGMIPNLLYTRYANQIRNRISRDFLKVDLDLEKAIMGMKDELARALFETCGLKALCPVPEGDRRPYEWFYDFAENVLGDRYPNIRLAVETLADFEFSVKGFMTYEIRNCLDDLDMSFGNVPPLINPQNGTMDRTKMSIYSNLHRTLCRIATTLEDVMKELYIKPNRAMFAEVADFCDRIYYSAESEMEWRNFYADQSSILWAEELRQQQAVGIMFQEWLDLVEALQQYNNSRIYNMQEEKTYAV